MTVTPTLFTMRDNAQSIADSNNRHAETDVDPWRYRVVPKSGGVWYVVGVWDADGIFLGYL